MVSTFQLKRSIRLSLTHTCVVMPSDKGNVAPLLGQSFLQRFDFKYTQGSGRLVLTKVEPDEPAATPGKSNGPRKKR
jgi:hypothetical protein